MIPLTPEAQRVLIQGGIAIAENTVNFVLGLIRSMNLTADAEKAHVAELKLRLSARADQVEAAPDFDPDAVPDPAPTVKP